MEDGDHNRDKELSDLRKKLSEARAKAREVEPELAARQREIKVVLMTKHYEKDPVISVIIIFLPSVYLMSYKTKRMSYDI